MKDFLLEMAIYNRKANEKMLSIIDSVPEEIYNKDMKVYYKNITGIIFHLAWAEIIWFKRYKGFFNYPTLENSSIVSADISKISDEYSGDYNKSKNLLKETNSIFNAFIEYIDEKDLFRKVNYKNVKGEEFNRVYWSTIFHVLNHGTHHRGEISAILGY